MRHHYRAERLATVRERMTVPGTMHKDFCWDRTATAGHADTARSPGSLGFGFPVDRSGK
jgi:hypothetical protein